eukprot:jgi/Botrbrau1/17637/Bobra.0166s0068.1
MRTGHSVAVVLVLLFGCLLLGEGKVERGSKAASADVEKVDAVQELIAAQAAAKDGVLHWDVGQFNKYAIGKKRPYTLIFFFTAKHLLNKPNLGLKKLRSEFGYLSKALVRKFGATGKIFLVQVEYQDSDELFRRFGVNSLPHIFRLSPTTAVGRDGSIKLKHDDVMRHEHYGHEIWGADDMASFVRDKTGLDVGKVEKPNVAQNPLTPVVALAVVGGLGFIAWKLYNAKFMQYLWLWAVAVLVVFCFSVSGGMHNIIRGVPFMYVDQSGKLNLFMNSGTRPAGGRRLHDGHSVHSLWPHLHGDDLFGPPHQGQDPAARPVLRSAWPLLPHLQLALQNTPLEGRPLLVFVFVVKIPCMQVKGWVACSGNAMTAGNIRSPCPVSAHPYIEPKPGGMYRSLGTMYR